MSPQGFVSRFLAFVLAAILSLAALEIGCSGINVVNDQDFDTLRKVKSGEYELVEKNELAQLRKDADIGRSVGRFQIHQQGWRTWRLDTATGDSCLLLTTDSEWKKPEITAQGCPPQ